MRSLRVLLPLIAIGLTACETPTTQRYAVSADNVQSIRSMGLTGIAVGAFAEPTDFSPMCRSLGAIQVADGLTHTQYIQRAFVDELKIAGAYSQGSPKVTLTGTVKKLEFSSTRALVGGSWAIEVVLRSSNGRTIEAGEYYEFSSGFGAVSACQNTAAAFSRAVQNLVGKVLKHSAFPALVAS